MPYRGISSPEWIKEQGEQSCPEDRSLESTEAKNFLRISFRFPDLNYISASPSMNHLYYPGDTYWEEGRSDMSEPFLC